MLPRAGIFCKRAQHCRRNGKESCSPIEDSKLKGEQVSNDRRLTVTAIASRLTIHKIRLTPAGWSGRHIPRPQGARRLRRYTPNFLRPVRQSDILGERINPLRWTLLYFCPRRETCDREPRRIQTCLDLSGRTGKDDGVIGRPYPPPAGCSKRHPTRPQVSQHRRRTLRGTLRILASRERRGRSLSTPC